MKVPECKGCWWARKATDPLTTTPTVKMFCCLTRPATPVAPEQFCPSHREQAPDPERAAPYGYCPTCGARGITRERRLGGNDTCENKHTYPSTDAVKRA